VGKSHERFSFLVQKVPKLSNQGKKIGFYFSLLFLFWFGYDKSRYGKLNGKRF